MAFIKKHKLIFGIIVVLLIGLGVYGFNNRAAFIVQHKNFTMGMTVMGESQYSKSTKAQFKSDHTVKFKGAGETSDPLSNLKWSSKGNQVNLTYKGITMATIDTSEPVTFKGHESYVAHFNFKEMAKQMGKSESMSDLTDEESQMTLYFVYK